jgi:NADH-quinone oxidoreductase subunit C
LTVETLEQIKARLESALPGVTIEIVANESVATQRSLLLGHGHALAAAQFLRDDPALQFDYCSNVTGVDWPEAVIKTKVKKKILVEGVEKEVEETLETVRPGHLEALYHLYSMALKHGPLILRTRTENRADKNHVPSLTPVWRGCEFQEREAYDLFGIVFDGHPDLRRILMWDEFEGHPMRKDYVEPDDYEYEPTPHDSVVDKVKAHNAQGVKA